MASTAWLFLCRSALCAVPRLMYGRERERDSSANGRAYVHNQLFVVMNIMRPGRVSLITPGRVLRNAASFFSSHHDSFASFLPFAMSDPAIVQTSPMSGGDEKVYRRQSIMASDIIFLHAERIGKRTMIDETSERGGVQEESGRLCEDAEAG